MMVMLGRHTPTIRSASSPSSPTLKASSTSASHSAVPHPLLTPRLRPTTISTSTPTTMASTTTVLSGLSGLPATTPSRKRKIIADPPTISSMDHKRSRTWTELEYEEMLEEATLLREELELLIAVAADLCRDLACDPTHVSAFRCQLVAIEEKMASTDDLTERQVREMCQQMIRMMKYLCERHYDHFALVEMQDDLRESRDRFMRFICQYAAMIGLFR